MTNGQEGSTAGGIELISVTSLATVNNLNKAKSISATTNIEQKSARNVVLSTSPSTSSTAAQMSSGKSIYQGGMGMVSSPSAAVSVAKAHVPTQCASVVGVFTAPSPRSRTGPVATRSAAAGVSSASEKASQTGACVTASTNMCQNCQLIFESVLIEDDIVHMQSKRCTLKIHYLYAQSFKTFSILSFGHMMTLNGLFQSLLLNVHILSSSNFLRLVQISNGHAFVSTQRTSSVFTCRTFECKSVCL